MTLARSRRRSRFEEPKGFRTRRAAWDDHNGHGRGRDRSRDNGIGIVGAPG